MKIKNVKRIKRNFKLIMLYVCCLTVLSSCKKEKVYTNYSLEIIDDNYNDSNNIDEVMENEEIEIIDEDPVIIDSIIDVKDEAEESIDVSFNNIVEVKSTNPTLAKMLIRYIILMKMH